MLLPASFPAPVGGEYAIDALSQVPLEPPGLERVTRLESEESLNQRIRQEYRARRTMERVPFPDEPIVSTERYRGREFPPLSMLVEPNYVSHGPLLFEQINSERYGWDLGVAGPLLSAGGFFADVITLPYHLASSVGCGWDTSAGKCLPGDPVPFLLYPPGLSLRGGVAETAAVIGVIAAFP
jgi:hypothetical protein